jgi:DNA repair protein RadC
MHYRRGFYIMQSQKSEHPHYLGHRKRIRERFLKTGLASFHDYEVLELLLTFAIAQKDVKVLAKQLISRFQTFQGVLDAPLNELKTVAGIGEHCALLMKLVKECSDFYLRGKIYHKDIISSPEALLNYCKSAMAGLGDEQFRVIYLNTKNEIIADELLQEGTVDQSAVYPRKIIEHALKHRASALIFVHNHPSGSPEPSVHDKNLTDLLKQISENIGIKVHDHLIIGKQGYFSFREEGCI